MTPGVLVFVMSLGILILCLPKEKVPIPMFIGSVLITLGQVIMIGSASFTVPRVLSTFAIVRMCIRGEIKDFGKLVVVDKLMIAWGVVLIVAGLLQEGTVAELIGRTGKMWDSVFVYFVFRCYVRKFDDMVSIIKVIIILFVIISFSMTIEKMSGRNFFSAFGGVPEFSLIRDGKLRAQGPFAHAIMAGTAAASSIPFILSLWYKDSQSRIFTIVGFIAAGLIIYDCASSSPIMTALFAFVGLGTWHYRSYMKQIRKGIVLGLITAEVTMESHVWYLIARIDLVGGSTGYHRAELINSAMLHLNEWWLYGTNYTRHWMPSGVPWSPNHTDITNWYLSNGVSGGLPQMLLFIAVICSCNKIIGTTLRRIEPSGDTFKSRLIWAFGATLFSHTISFLTNSYFDQIKIFWYLFLAMVASCASANEEKSSNESISEGTVYYR